MEANSNCWGLTCERCGAAQREEGEAPPARRVWASSVQVQVPAKTTRQGHTRHATPCRLLLLLPHGDPFRACMLDDPPCRLFCGCTGGWRSSCALMIELLEQRAALAPEGLTTSQPPNGTIFAQLRDCSGAGELMRTLNTRHSRDPCPCLHPARGRGRPRSSQAQIRVCMQRPAHK